MVIPQTADWGGADATAAGTRTAGTPYLPALLPASLPTGLARAMTNANAADAMT